MTSGVAIVTILGLALAGCTSSSSTPHAGDQKLPGVHVAGLPKDFDVTISEATGDSAAPPEAVEPDGGSPALASKGSGVFQLGPSGPLPQAAHVAVQLKRPAPSGTLAVVATREASSEKWTYLRGRLNPDRTTVTFNATHFSIFDVLFVDVSAMWEEFKKDFIDGLTSGVTASASKPSCENEQGARTGGFHVTSSTTNTVYWCFGYDKADAVSTRVLKVVNDRPYPLLVTPSNMSVIRNDHKWAELAQLSRLGGRTIIDPSGTLILNADLDPGDGERIDTEFDGFGQSLYALQTGLETLDKILTRFGAGSGSSTGDLLAKALEVPECLEAFTEGTGAVVAKCLSAKDMFDIFGAGAGLIVAPLATVGGLVQFFVSEVSSAVDVVTGRDHYQILITRDGPSTSDPATTLTLAGGWNGITPGSDIVAAARRLGFSTHSYCAPVRVLNDRSSQPEVAASDGKHVDFISVFKLGVTGPDGVRIGDPVANHPSLTSGGGVVHHFPGSQSNQFDAYWILRGVHGWYFWLRADPSQSTITNFGLARAYSIADERARTQGGCY
jgi:hypothetical protein